MLTFQMQMQDYLDPIPDMTPREDSYRCTNPRTGDRMTELEEKDR